MHAWRAPCQAAEDGQCMRGVLHVRLPKMGNACVARVDHSPCVPIEELDVRRVAPLLVTRRAVSRDDAVSRVNDAKVEPLSRQRT